jgi:pimeloyl-ACP methyl ester carboxylesterase
MKDKFITPEFLAQWLQRFPNAQLSKLDCGHFVQEEEPESAIEAMEMFFADKKW